MGRNVSDHWPGIDELFEPGVEIALARTTEDALALLTETHADDRRAMGEALRRRVLAEHSSAKRAVELEALLLAPAVLP